MNELNGKGASELAGMIASGEVTSPEAIEDRFPVLTPIQPRVAATV
jgi:hypothetical protein